ncbi:uncharacterized protein LOC130614809 [Hydractinia symbiolongicarpus]|uniref:uncharacterized protein LOC130614809 n=1 Tax=Hydractinia symbiolongicarpus TaxID=13093 RepID=UPI00254F80E0|nr:uncharacterized protein LOC130614809 [Hydractinia symbiolongicarpus]
MGKKRDFGEYNPSPKNRVASVYLPWLAGVSFVMFVVGIVICVCAGLMRVYNDDLNDLLFQVWVGIPLVVVSVLGFTSVITRAKEVVNVLALLSLLTMAVCGFGAVTGGLTYWEDQWQLVKELLNDNKCSVQASACQCNVDNDVLPMPMRVDSCTNLERVVFLYITMFSLDAFGVILSFLTLLMSMMVNCCGAWTYLPWYDRRIDPDNGVNEKYVQREAGFVNGGYKH